jgi:Tol biopolymer transport system component
MPRWSADGTKLAFVAGDQVFTVQADGAEPKQLTTRGSNFAPVWSFDGREIAYMSSRSDYSYWIRIMGEDGTGDHWLWWPASRDRTS